MAGRYLVSGTQLGVLIALCKTDPDKCNKEINLLIENQFVGNSDKVLTEDIKKVSIFLHKHNYQF